MAVSYTHLDVYKRQVYITLDIDFLDPAAAPGTGTPKPGGFSTREMLELLRIFARLPIIGMDVVEVSPPFDHADITSFAAQRALTCLLYTSRCV